MDKQVLAAISGMPDERAVEDFFDTAMANPDEERMGGPFDGVQGLSTITRQKIAKSISFAGLTGDAFDVFIVDWGVESMVASGQDCYAAFVLRDVTAISAPGYWDLASSVTSWSTAGLPNGIEVGGVKAYIMLAGNSPFPSNNPDVSGPVAPLKTVSLVFDKDVLHDSMRVLGSNYEYIDTTNALNQQGSCFQGSWDTPQENDISMIIANLGAGWIQSGATCVRGLPPGSVDSLVKLNNCRIGKAKDGTFVHTRLDWAENKPSFPYQANTLWIGDRGVASGGGLIPALGKYQVGLAMYSGVQVNSAGSAEVYSCYNGYTYQTAKLENMTVFTGLSPSHTATIERTLITQCFVPPASEYKAFAVLSHNPVSYEVMQRMQNTMDTTPEFWPSAANANGSFIKKAKSVWKKLSPVVKPIAGVAARTLLGAGAGVTRSLMDEATSYALESSKLNGSPGHSVADLTRQLESMRQRAVKAENTGSKLAKALSEGVKATKKSGKRK